MNNMNIYTRNRDGRYFRTDDKTLKLLETASLICTYMKSFILNFTILPSLPLTSSSSPLFNNPTPTAMARNRTLTPLHRESHTVSEARTESLAWAWVGTNTTSLDGQVPTGLSEKRERAGIHHPPHTKQALVFCLCLILGWSTRERV